MINYYLISKPGIIMGNVVTLFAGIFLASKGSIPWGAVLMALIGIVFIIASACVFNNIIDQEIDEKMKRTKNRPLVQGLISGKSAFAFATFLAILGNIAFYFTNSVTLLLANLGLFVYVVLYSFWKVKTIYGTAIGSIAGALPPVIGYTTVTGKLDAPACILFLTMLFWQMPHFYAIAITHFEDYKRANLPLLPHEKGILRTQVHMLLYVIGFLFSSALLTLLGYAGVTYLALVFTASILWLALSIQGFSAGNEKIWARKMFRVSLVVINTLCLGLFINFVQL